MAIRWFRKGTEPKELRDWMKLGGPDVTWDALTGEVRAAMRVRLAKEQSGLCCYCYELLELGAMDPIEHLKPRSTHRDQMFEWENLLLSCDGGAKGGRPPHCDRAKGAVALTVVHPHRRPTVSVAVMSRANGALRVMSEAKADIQTLQIDRRFLRQQRRSALEAQLRDLGKGSAKRDSSWTALKLERVLKRLRSRKHPGAYQPWVEGWLERQIANR